jgi:hypothetical protein
VDLEDKQMLQTISRAFATRWKINLQRSLVVCIALFSAGITIRADVSYQEAYASLQTNRDRLLTQYAQDYNLTAAQGWNAMSSAERWEFLVITDLLGRRSIMYNNLIHNYQMNTNMNDWAGCFPMNSGADCNSGCYFPRTPPSNSNDTVILECNYGSGESCVANGWCSDYWYQGPQNWDMALSHVTKLYAVFGGPDCGGASNRVYFQADYYLISALRNTPSDLFLPAWGGSSDPFGSHEPFTFSGETAHGQPWFAAGPRGQYQCFSVDAQAVPISRSNFYNYGDPWLVEIDVDFNFNHHSNPECTYDGEYGYNKYQDFWYYQGLWGPAEYWYQPPND